MANPVQTLLVTGVKLLESYRGRDSVLRILGYSSTALSELTNPAISRKLKIISKEFSHCRLLLRLFDDLPMLAYTLSYGFGDPSKEDATTRIISVLRNLFDQLYYPLEHMAWVLDSSILRGDSSIWWALGDVCWTLSLFLNIIDSLHALYRLRKQKDANSEKKEHLLMLVQSAADFMNGVHWLPPGWFLWSGRLPQVYVGVFGVISSIIILSRRLGQLK